MTDSTSLPRSYPGGKVQWENIYVNLLRKERPEDELIHVGIGAATITKLLALQNYYMFVKPDLVVLQCGLVDCAPRAFGELELELIKKMRIFRLVKPFFKLLRKYRGVTYVTPRKFEKTLLEFKARFSGVPLVSIGILPACPEYEQKVPRITENVERYNNILSKHTFYINNDDFPREAITPDHHHINEKGHALLCEKLQEQISALEAEKGNNL